MFHLLQIRSLNTQITTLRKEIDNLESAINKQEDIKPEEVGTTQEIISRENVSSWVFIDGTGSFHSHATLQPKHRGQGTGPSVANMCGDVKRFLRDFARSTGAFYEFYRLDFGYIQVVPNAGLQVRGNVILKESTDVTRTEQGYYLDIQQHFDNLEFSENSDILITEIKQPTVVGEVYAKTVNFILPLAGRFETFVRFMDRYNRLFLSTKENVTLVIAHTVEKEGNNKETGKIYGVIKNSRKQYPKSNIQLVEIKGEFSRGIALNKGASLFQNDSLLFFLDVDIHLSRDVLHRIRANAIQNRQVYFPIMYSEYHPKFSCSLGEYKSNHKCPVVKERNHFDFSQTSGNWRKFSFGEVGIYKSDFDQLGGYDTTIVGWGKEDIDLMEKTFKHKLVPFNAVDPGIVHIYHPYHCDPNLARDQYVMCLQSMRSNYASSEILTERVSENDKILQRHESQWWQLIEHKDITL